ncbi:MAG: GNAT family N-acetyltransferase [Armatimonadetes bacterium]|nr:GNAT family N-acetyltransferase [Armatimonadota bacterium]
MPEIASPSQMYMLRPHLEGLPELALPAGFGLRTYRPGDEAAWARIMNHCIGRDWTTDRCRREMVENPAIPPDSFFFATRGDEPVGTACAQIQPPGQRDLGTIHMVGVAPECRGHGLGTLLTLAVLRWLADQGFRRAQLSTDDWRLPAIRTYLRLGLLPVLFDARHRARWQAVCAQLGWPYRDDWPAAIHPP